MAYNRDSSLWMGDLQPYMDEEFLKISFRLAGVPEVLRVKIVKNKHTGFALGYGFVHFGDDQTALTVMHRLNGKIVPNTTPPIRFKLNHSSLSGRGSGGVEKEFSLWVGDLSPEVDDLALYKCFATRYQTIHTAKVILDQNGFSKGYAFIRFGEEGEHKDALAQMHGFRGLGTKPIKVSIAIPKGQKGQTNKGYGENTQVLTGEGTNSTGSGSDYSQYYEQYWNNYAAWQNYGSYYDSSGQTGAGTGGNDEFTLVEHNTPVDVDAMNRSLIERTEEFWDAMEESRWLPRDGPDSVIMTGIKA